ncbi:MAG: response regulator [Firmicutes bacterium]|nr:response regulator [Bacillota bacterium]
MINVLLVDDEPLMREALRTLFDWGSHGFRIIGEAYNGVEALKIMEQQQMDIVLADIKMPVMDGLELIQTARKYNKATVFVVLSAYDEFRLVSNAYKMGAKDYILKSEMTEEQVIQVLQKAYHEMMEIRQQQKQMEEQEQTCKLFEKHRQEIYYRLLKEVIEGRFSIKHQQDLIKLGLRFAGDRVAIMVICVESYVRTDYSKRISSELSHSLLEYLENILNNHKTGNLLPYLPGEYIILSCFDSKDSVRDINEKMTVLYNDIRKKLEAQFGVIVSAGLSRIGKGMSIAGELYQQALIACQNSFVQGKGKLIRYAYLPPEINRDMLNADRKLTALKESLKSMEPKKIRDGLDFMIVQVEVVSQKMIDDIRKLFERYYTCICEYGRDYFLDQDLACVLEEYNKNLRDSGDLKQLNNWIRKTLTVVACAIENGNYLINRVKNYLHKNYQNNISLSLVAREMGVSSSYLSRVFTKKVGCSFINYLTRVRLSAGLEYMRNSNMKIYEVAEKVGYSSAEHYSRMFKKVFGKSPKEYLG